MVPALVSGGEEEGEFCCGLEVVCTRCMKRASSWSELQGAQANVRLVGELWGHWSLKLLELGAWERGKANRV